MKAQPLFVCRLFPVCASLSLCLFVSLFLSASPCLSVSVSFCLSLCLSVSVSLSLSVCLSLCLSVSVSLSLSVCLSLCLSVSVSLSLSVCLSLCLSVSVSISLSLSVSRSVLRLSYFQVTCSLHHAHFTSTSASCLHLTANSGTRYKLGRQTSSRSSFLSVLSVLWLLDKGVFVDSLQRFTLSY